MVKFLYFKGNFVIFVLTLYLLSFITTLPVYASTFSILENFDDNNSNDGNPIDWNESAGTSGSWESVNGQYVGKAFRNGSSPSMSTYDDETLTDYSVNVDITGISGVDRHLLVRFNRDRNNPQGYAIKYVENNFGYQGHVELQRTGVAVVASNTNFKSHIGETHSLKIVLNKQNIRVLIDNIEYINYNDPNPILSGGIGFFVENPGLVDSGFNGYNITRYDNLQIEEIDDSLLVPSLKQFSSPWGDDVYDHLNPPKNTIADKGCALTSATMILQYYGYNVTPGELNEWMKQTPGSFTREGGIIWAAISKYAKEHKNSNLPNLEFKYLGNDLTHIDENLNLKQPVMLKYSDNSAEKMHFVVAKGKAESGYYINDPGSNSKTNSNEIPGYYKAPLTNIGLFTPSETDLSYIILFVDKNVQMRVFNQDGTLITEGYEIENPYINPFTLDTTGKALNAFYLPKPVSGKYKIELTTTESSQFQLDTYLFDLNVENLVISKNGSIDTDETKTFILDYQKETIQESLIDEVTIEKIISDLDKGRENNLINNGAYHAVRASLVSAKKASEKNHLKLVLPFLKLALMKIENLSDKQIASELSEYLIYELHILIQ